MADPATHAALSGLGAGTPIVAAPMAGGPSTPELVLAAADAGGLGFLAGGYRGAEALKEQIATVRAAGVSFGVNLFAPNPVPVDPEQYRRYAATIAGEAARYDLDLAGAPIVQDDDSWSDKIDLLVADPVPLVSFTFAVPPCTSARADAVGTVLLRSHEAGTSANHQAALADPAREATVVTRAFTGRPARGLRNRFTDRYTRLAAGLSGAAPPHQPTAQGRRRGR
jgi:NAD(P)H-dependent flavin oxidoreductase YrpB (nitropropane dioxygenase family)